MKGAFRRPIGIAARLMTFGLLLSGSQVATADEGAVAALLEQGEGLFLVNCRQCHGTKGTAGTPLANNKNLEDPAMIATAIIKGRGYMTPFGEHLDDAEIAAIATFIRNTWGNEYGPVSADDIAAAR